MSEKEANNEPKASFSSFNHLKLKVYDHDSVRTYEMYPTLKKIYLLHLVIIQKQVVYFVG